MNDTLSQLTASGVGATVVAAVTAHGPSGNTVSLILGIATLLTQIILNRRQRRNNS